MTHTEFCYWLQGFFELTPNLKTLDETQIKMIKQHLDLTFKKVTTHNFPVEKKPFVKIRPPFYEKDEFADVFDFINKKIRPNTNLEQTKLC